MEVKVFVNRRHIAYRPPFSVEAFKSGLVIGVDAGGLNCVRFVDSAPGHIGCGSAPLMTAACDALNAEPIADHIAASFQWEA